MQDNKMQQAKEQFILQRINDCGSSCHPELDFAYEQFAASAAELQASLSEQQELMFRKC